MVIFHSYVHVHQRVNQPFWDEKKPDFSRSVKSLHQAQHMQPGPHVKLSQIFRSNRNRMVFMSLV